MNKKNKKNKGFSLVELIIVIAIMAILAGVMVPQFIKYINESKKSADIQQAQVIYDAVMTAYADDAVNGTHNAPDGSHEVDDAMATNLGISTTAPTSKIKANTPFTYNLTDTSGTITLTITVGGAEVSPSPSADWQ